MGQASHFSNMILVRRVRGSVLVVFSQEGGLRVERDWGLRWAGGHQEDRQCRESLWFYLLHSFAGLANIFRISNALYPSQDPVRKSCLKESPKDFTGRGAPWYENVPGNHRPPSFLASH